MALYKIEFLKSAELDARKINKQNLRRILENIRALEDNPFPNSARSLKNSNISYRLQVGDYRVLYNVDEENRSVTIYYIRHRKDAYRQK
jgi:mRNA interferase RelE/StbE